MAMMLPPIKNRQTGWRLFLMTVIGRSYPRVVGMQRELSWIFFDTFLPMLGVVAYVFVYRAIKAPEDYVGFVVVGGAMMAYWMNVLWSMSSQLYWEKETGNLALYIISPGPMMGILLGMAMGGLFATTLRALGIVILGQSVLPGALCHCQLLAIIPRILPYDGRIIRPGNDDCILVSTTQP